MWVVLLYIMVTPYYHDGGGWTVVTYTPPGGDKAGESQCHRVGRAHVGAFRDKSKVFYRCVQLTR